MKTVLIFPPSWTPAMPHLALPVLTATLRRRGHEVIQRDLNIETFDEILTRKRLRSALERIRTRFGPGASGRPLPFGRPEPEAVRWALEQGPQLAAHVEEAKAALRSPAFYDAGAGGRAFLTAAAALELFSLAYFPARLDFGRFTSPGRPDSSADLLRAARDPQVNPFHELFGQILLKDLLRERPGLIGISVPTEGQMLAALTIAALVRAAGLKCHITLGGAHITMLREQIPQAPALFDLIDSAVVFDGEVPLLRLAEALESGTGLSEVPALIYRGEGGQVRSNPPPGLDEVRAAQQDQQPDFHGLALEKCLAPELVLPLAATHGCYHGKCGFCNVGYGNPFHYFPYPLEQVTANVTRVQREFGCKHVFFVDEAITPRMLRALSPALKGMGSPIDWAGAVRLEKALTAPLLEEMAAGGCRMLLFGLESACEPIIDRMTKGTRRAEMSRVLRDGAAAGIWNHTFFFFGFPGETIENAQETVNFVYEHQDVIHSASPGAFLLERYSPVFQNPERYGVSGVRAPAGADLAIAFDYQTASGMDEAAAGELADRLVEQLPQKPNGHFYINDVYKLLYASNLRRRGLPMPRWIE